MLFGPSGFREQKRRRERYRNGTIDGTVTVLRISSTAADVDFAFVVFAKRVTDSVLVCLVHQLNFKRLTTVYFKNLPIGIVSVSKDIFNHKELD